MSCVTTKRNHSLLLKVDPNHHRDHLSSCVDIPPHRYKTQFNVITCLLFILQCLILQHTSRLLLIYLLTMTLTLGNDIFLHKIWHIIEVINVHEWWDPCVFQDAYVISPWNMQADLDKPCEQILQILSHTYVSSSCIIQNGILHWNRPFTSPP